MSKKDLEIEKLKNWHGYLEKEQARNLFFLTMISRVCKGQEGHQSDKAKVEAVLEFHDKWLNDRFTK